MLKDFPQVRVCVGEGVAVYDNNSTNCCLTRRDSHSHATGSSLPQSSLLVLRSLNPEPPAPNPNLSSVRRVNRFICSALKCECEVMSCFNAMCVGVAVRVCECLGQYTHSCRNILPPFHEMKQLGEKVASAKDTFVWPIFPLRTPSYFRRVFGYPKPNPFYSSANMCMPVNKAACLCVSLCAFNDKIIRKLFVYFVAGARSLRLSPRCVVVARMSSHIPPCQCHRQFATSACFSGPGPACVYGNVCICFWLLATHIWKLPNKSSASASASDSASAPNGLGVFGN